MKKVVAKIVPERLAHRLADDWISEGTNRGRRRRVRSGPVRRSSLPAPTGAPGREVCPVSQLAYNYKGQRFTPPTEARFWRVRRLREGQRGQLDVVRGADGRPLIVPIDIDVDGFRVAVSDRAGRYRLDALDEHEMVLASVDAAYVTVPMAAPQVDAEELEVQDPVDGARGAPLLRNAAPAVEAPKPTTVTAPFGVWPALPMPASMTGTEYLLAEALRGQVQMFQMVTVALANQGAAASAGASQMMGAAAELVRAADGAAMPRRPPPPPAPAAPPTAGPSPALPPIVLAAPGSLAARNAAPDCAEDWDEGDGEGDDETDEHADGADADAEADVFAKMMTLADKVQGVIAPVADVARLVMGGMGAGVRNGAPQDEAAGDHDGDAEASPALDVAHLRTSHILLIAHELGADGSLFRRLLMAMEPEDRQSWTDRLCAMTFEEAVDEVASKLERIKARQARRGTKQTRRASSQDAGGDDAGADELHGNGRGASGHSDSGDVDGQSVGSEEGDGDESDEADRSDPERDGAIDVGGGDEAVGDEQIADDGEGSHDDGDAASDPTDSAAATTPASGPSIAAAPPPSPAAVQARMMEIAKHLRVPEILQAQRMVAQLATSERDIWIGRLMALAPPEAAQVVRAELARRSKS
ncbi:MAG TPA: hypothetical protein VHE35_07475 [Kofleriaceae bacterium]|nr:hypothetical protein [Kofleriaceae bacterium]